MRHVMRTLEQQTNTRIRYTIEAKENYFFTVRDMRLKIRAFICLLSFFVDYLSKNGT